MLQTKLLTSTSRIYQNTFSGISSILSLYFLTKRLIAVTSSHLYGAIYCEILYFIHCRFYITKFIVKFKILSNIYRVLIKVFNLSSHQVTVIRILVYAPTQIINSLHVAHRVLFHRILQKKPNRRFGHKAVITLQIETTSHQAAHGMLSCKICFLNSLHFIFSFPVCVFCVFHHYFSSNYLLFSLILDFNAISYHQIYPESSYISIKTSCFFNFQ